MENNEITEIKCGVYDVIPDGANGTKGALKYFFTENQLHRPNLFNNTRIFSYIQSSVKPTILLQDFSHFMPFVSSCV